MRKRGARSLSARTIIAALLGVGGIVAAILGLEVGVVRGLPDQIYGTDVGMRVFMWAGNHEIPSVALTIGLATTLMLTLASLRYVRFRPWALVSSFITFALGIAAFFFLRYSVKVGMSATFPEFINLTRAVFPGSRAGFGRILFFGGSVTNLLGLAVIKGPEKWISVDGQR